MVSDRSVNIPDDLGSPSTSTDRLDENQTVEEGVRNFIILRTLIPDRTFKDVMYVVIVEGLYLRSRNRHMFVSLVMLKQS